MYQNTLLLIMDINNYNFLPNYPYTNSLADVKNNANVESYCLFILTNLNLLIDMNK